MALRDWLTPATLATPATHEAAAPSTVATVASVAGPAAANQERLPVATREEAAELRVLLHVVAGDWPDVEQAEAIALALSDPADALTCFRAIVADNPKLAERLARARARTDPQSPYTTLPLAERDPTDERRTCNDCAELSPSGRCLAAAKGKRIHACRREYYPIPDLLGRCEHFMPLPGDPDQTPGAERWARTFNRGTHNEDN